MRPENKQFLDDNRHHWLTLTKAKYMKCLNANEREGMVRVMREEFQPGYSADLWCSPCVSDMVLMLYRRYDAWIDAQPKEEPAPALPEIIPETMNTIPEVEEIIPEGTLIVHSSFPLNEKEVSLVEEIIHVPVAKPLIKSNGSKKPKRK